MTSSERKTREFKTSGGHIIVLNDYVTAREMVEIGDKKDIPDSQKTQKVLGLAVVQLDGSGDNAIDRLLDLPMKDYLELVKEVTAMITPTTPENSAQPGTGTSQTA